MSISPVNAHGGHILFKTLWVVCQRLNEIKKPINKVLYEDKSLTYWAISLQNEIYENDK